jgi:predicted nucleotidyltransferase
VELAINTTPKEMAAGGLHTTTATAINDLDFPTNTRNDKAFSTLRAAYAMRGHTLHRSHPGDGAVAYYATKWGMVKHLPDLDAAREFLRQIGGAV